MDKISTQTNSVATRLDRIEALINRERGIIPQVNPELRRAMIYLKRSKTSDAEAISGMDRHEAGLAEGAIMNQLMETLRLDTDPRISAGMGVDRRLDVLGERMQSDWRIAPPKLCEEVANLAQATGRKELAEALRDFSTILRINTTQ